ncbi:hypothetical protein ACVGX5_08330, partial [Enterobacter intestinihominis]
DEIRASVGCVSGIIRVISIATRDQMKGIHENNHGVYNLDRMVQHKAELVLQYASAASALQSQAGDLGETCLINTSPTPRDLYEDVGLGLVGY